MCRPLGAESAAGRALRAAVPLTLALWLRVPTYGSSTELGASAGSGEHAAELVVQRGEDCRFRCAVAVDVRVQGESFGERNDLQGLVSRVDALSDLAAHRAVVDGLGDA